MSDDERIKAKHQLLIGETSVEEAKERLGLSNNPEDDFLKVEGKERQPLDEKVTQIDLDNYMMVTGSLENNDLKLSVVSIFDLKNAKDLPDLVMTQNEIDVWRYQLMDYISNNAEMLAKALLTTVK